MLEADCFEIVENFAGMMCRKAVDQSINQSIAGYLM